MSSLSGLQEELKEQVKGAGQSGGEMSTSESLLDLAAEGGHPIMCCQVHLGIVPPEIRKKSRFQTGNWVRKTLTLTRTRPGNTGLQGARVLPALSAVPWGRGRGEGGWLLWLGRS